MQKEVGRERSFTPIQRTFLQFSGKGPDVICCHCQLPVTQFLLGGVAIHTVVAEPNKYAVRTRETGRAGGADQRLFRSSGSRSGDIFDRFGRGSQAEQARRDSDSCSLLQSWSFVGFYLMHTCFFSSSSPR